MIAFYALKCLNRDFFECCYFGLNCFAAAGIDHTDQIAFGAAFQRLALSCERQAAAVENHGYQLAALNYHRSLNIAGFNRFSGNNDAARA